MVTIRLARHGSKKNPFYHITVADRSAKRDGRFVERLGFFNPLAAGKSEELRVDLKRVDYWLSVGAQPSDRVRKLIRQARDNESAPTGAPSPGAPASDAPATQAAS
jgi:small subunit ribosomal protein S16